MNGLLLHLICPNACCDSGTVVETWLKETSLQLRLTNRVFPKLHIPNGYVPGPYFCSYWSKFYLKTVSNHRHDEPSAEHYQCLTRNASMKLLVRSSRSFATISIRQVKIAELSKRQLADIKIDQDRLWAELHKTCEWGKWERWGE